MQAKIVKPCDRIASTLVFPLFDLQKGTVNMLEILLMISLGPWLIGVGVVTYAILRHYFD